VTTHGRAVTLVWRSAPGAPKVDHFEIARSGGDRTATTVYNGLATRFTDTDVQSGIEYRYLVTVVAPDGGRSVGVVALVTPTVLLITTPKQGARLAAPVVATWKPQLRATYYNAQVYCNSVKVLSAWPTKARFVIQQRVKYEGRWHTTVGTCRLYVWPGFGRRADKNYGAVMGPIDFTILPARKTRKR